MYRHYDYHRTKWAWAIAFTVSIIAHFGLYSIYGRHHFNHDPLIAQAVMIEFSDPPQSITISHSRPIGELQTQSLASQSSYIDQKISQQETLPMVETHQPLPQKVDIAVNTHQRTKEKALQKSQPKRPLVVHKSINNKHDAPKKTALSATNSVANPVKNTAPPPLAGKKIAAEFNSSGQNQTALLNWKAKVQTLLDKNLRYPMQALNKQWQGKTQIKVTINANGTVLNAEVVYSSGKSILDNEAIDLIKRVHLPAPPNDILTHNVVISHFPIIFDLEKGNQH